ncbi:MAG: hypothetical protein WKF30_09240 [Pyrinomonadaceae bacterium]
MLIDPAGYLVGQVSGEGNYEGIDRAIAQTVEEFRKRGELNEQPLKLALERAKVGDLPLAFPGKVLADARGDRLFIADSNHNRIVITKLDGTLIETIGTGAAGAQNGAFAGATFYRPQGLALDGDSLYIADTENHLIRRADLRARTVDTLAGTGGQSKSYGKVEGPGAATALNSPWDLQFVGRTLYIAMAGPHQIWQLDLDTQVVGTYAGSGREARLDGAREEAGFAQPSGITTDGKIFTSPTANPTSFERLIWRAAKCAPWLGAIFSTSAMRTAGATMCGSNILRASSQRRKIRCSSPTRIITRSSA